MSQAIANGFSRDRYRMPTEALQRSRRRGRCRGECACRAAREQLYLQTKFTPLGGQDPKRISIRSRGAAGGAGRESIAVSLRNLQTDYIDCLVLHSPLRNMKDTEQVWQAMRGGARIRHREAAWYQ